MTSQPHRQIDIITAALPPAYDAIGDYSTRLAAAFVNRGIATRLLTTKTRTVETIANAEIAMAFNVAANDFSGLYDALCAPDAAEFALLQYNPFSWGSRGWAPGLVRALTRAKSRNKSLRLAVMFHEIYMLNPGVKSWIMRCWQKHQLAALVKLANICFVSTQRWSKAIEQAGGLAVPLPVGSNLPCPASDQLPIRSRLGIDADSFVCGALGSTHPSRPWQWVGTAVKALQDAGLKPVLVYIGGSVDDVKAVCGDTPVLATGRLPGAEAAAHLRLMDLFLSPFLDGVSTRRSSIMAALQNGVPTVSTRSEDTDSVFLYGTMPISLSCVNGGAEAFASCCLAMAKDSQLRLQRAAAGRILYETRFDWPVIANRVVYQMSQEL